MVQWINVLRNNSFVNPTRLLLLCKKLAQPGITAGRLADWLTGSQADKILLSLEIFKNHIATG